MENKSIWRVMDRTFLRVARYADWMHLQATSEGVESQHDESHQHTDSLISSATILHGPFKGLAYSNDQFCCSAIPPKLLGSYEREIHAWLEEIIGKKYEGVIDVGCAEGYYAVGLAWRMKKIPVYAYDINIVAREQCKKLAASNGVENLVELRSYCDPDELKNVVNGRRFLIIADCEGYEKTLFSDKNIASLVNSDIIIEVHDFMDLTILPHLRELFASSHRIQEVESVDDLRKLDRYDYPELRGFDIHERYRTTAEWRKRIMIWMYMTPIQSRST